MKLYDDHPHERRSLKESVELDMLYTDENLPPNRGQKRINVPQQVYRAAEVDENEYEAKKLLGKEEELMKKARDLENEMLQIK